MRSVSRIAVALSCVVVMSSCTTQILDSATTTTVAGGDTTTTTLPTPEGDIEQLLTQFDSTIDGLGQLIVDAKSKEAKAVYARAQAIWAVLKPQVEASGVIGLDEDMKRIVELVRTATERKRPADADKADRFLSLLRESLPDLLNR